MAFFFWHDTDVFYFIEVFLREYLFPPPLPPSRQGRGNFWLFHFCPNLLASSITSMSGMPVFIANALQSSYSGTMLHTPPPLPDIFTRTVPYGRWTSFISRVRTKRVIFFTLTPIVVVSLNINSLMAFNLQGDNNN